MKSGVEVLTKSKVVSWKLLNRVLSNGPLPMRNSSPTAKLSAQERLGALIDYSRQRLNQVQKIESRADRLERLRSRIYRHYSIDDLVRFDKENIYLLIGIY